MPSRPCPNYGVDAPSVVMTFACLAVAVAFAGIFIGSAAGSAYGLPFWISAIAFAGMAAAMIRSSKRGKPALWAATLDALNLRGDESSLDIGCGRGLVLIETAKRLPQGHVSGIDIWRAKDQSGNSHVMTDLNAEMEGVADRITVIDADMTDTAFADDSFELVTASLAIHNLADAGHRQMALSEIVRVLRPGGRVVIIDIGRTREFETIFKEAGLEGVNRSRPTLSIYPPARIVTATKPLTLSPPPQETSRRISG